MLHSAGDIWALLSARAGDNAQVLALARAVAEATGMRVVEKSLRYSLAHLVPNVLRGASIAAVRKDLLPLLSPPWPRLVLAAGRRSAPVALWIKSQAGAATRLVQIGRPRMDLRRFDLVVTTAQYGLPQLENVVALRLPFSTNAPAARADMEQFSAAWTHLPRPWTVVNVGAAKFPLRLGEAEIGHLGELLNLRLKANGGSAILIDSPRTPAALLPALTRALDVPFWKRDQKVSSNPYRAALALADAVVVTSDSVSMVGDAVGAGKPVWIFRLPVAALSLSWSADLGLARGLAMRGLVSPPRNVARLMDHLVRAGVVGDLEKGLAPATTFNLDHERSALVARIVALL